MLKQISSAVPINADSSLLSIFTRRIDHYNSFSNLPQRFLALKTLNNACCFSLSICLVRCFLDVSKLPLLLNHCPYTCCNLAYNICRSASVGINLGIETGGWIYDVKSNKKALPQVFPLFQTGTRNYGCGWWRLKQTLVMPMTLESQTKIKGVKRFISKPKRPLRWTPKRRNLFDPFF